MKTSPVDFTNEPFTQAERDHFWERVQKSDTCWLWTGACMVNGYGLLTIHGRQVLAHRLAYYFACGDLPNDKQLNHTCDVRNCVNPQHLIPGTQAENLLDAIARGRRGKGKSHTLRGEKIGTSKLKFADAQSIRSEYAAGGISQRALARKYGVTQHTILEIVKGRSWQHDTPNPDPSTQKVSRTCLNCGKVFIRTVSIYQEEKEPLCSKTCRTEWDKQYASERFWKYVDQSNPDGCWNWQGFIYKNGYGCAGGMNVGKIRDRLAHRVAWRLTYGDIPTGLHILHSCDNRACVNPAHLSLGTRSDNMQDASRKGRMQVPKPRKKQNVQILSMRGELHPNSKLTNLQRQEIRDRYEKGESYSVLGKAFGVNKTTIGYIVKPKYHDSPPS